MRMGVEDILLLEEERGCTGIFWLFSRDCHGRTLFLLLIFLCLGISDSYFSRPHGSACFSFLFLIFIVFT